MGSTAPPRRTMGHHPGRPPQGARGSCRPDSCVGNFQIWDCVHLSQYVTVDGVNLGPTTDFVSIFRRQMLEGSVWSVFRDQSPQEGLEMAFGAIRDTALEPTAVD